MFMLHVLIALLCFDVCPAVTFSFRHLLSQSPFGHQIQQRIASPSPLRHIEKWAALGDSYAAGIGAGNRLGDWSSYTCSRYNNSYPYLLHTHPYLDINTTTFDFLACSGATSSDVLNGQVPYLANSANAGTKPKYDLITLSSGGNDIGLSNILNACVFQWSSGSYTSPATHEECDAQLNITASLVKTTLPDNLDALHAALLPFLEPGGKVLHTGYAKFFDDTEHACDNVTWAFWYGKYLGWEREYLTVERRRKMNELVEETNLVIKESVRRINDQIQAFTLPAQTAASPSSTDTTRNNRAESQPSFRFISTDPRFQASKGRFCEPGIHEPAPNREDLLFYEWDTVDSAKEAKDGVDGLKAGNATRGTFEGDVAKWVEEGSKKRKESKSEKEECEEDCKVQEESYIIPDGYLRVFHPRPRGHMIVAEEVLKVLLEEVGGQLEERVEL